MEHIEPIVVEQRMSEQRRFAAELRAAQAASNKRSRPGIIRQVMGAWLIDVGCRLRGTTPMALRDASLRP
jgi:hypothetical protein